MKAPVQQEVARELFLLWPERSIDALSMLFECTIKCMRKFKDDEAGYLEWHLQNRTGFVFNHFGGNDPGYNKLHRSTCSFLRREKDENARTTVEKWCSETENELVQHIEEFVGLDMWTRCSVCFAD
ncbi:MAG: hypothetical protein VX288_04950 [Planctomycetota bacterium]|nr:hypothetical protein [Planctomycetota bacterium]